MPSWAEEIQGGVHMSPERGEIRARRSLLIVPIRQRTVEKAPTTQADVLMLDLDDGVPYTEIAKSEARDLVAQALSTADFHGKEVVVRINPLDTPWWREDIEAVAHSSAHAVVPPKIESAEDIRRVDPALLEAGDRGLSGWAVSENEAPGADLC